MSHPFPKPRNYPAWIPKSETAGPTSHRSTIDSTRSRNPTMKLVRIPLAAAAILSLGFACAAPASAEGGHFTPKPQHAVSKGQSAPGTSNLASLAPANDSLSGAQFLPSANNSISSRNTGATVEVGEPSHGDQLNPASNSVWFRWRAPATGRAIFRTIGSNYDTVMAAYRSASSNPSMAELTQIAANDDLVLDNSTTASQIKFNATAGTDYFIAVDGFGAATGDIKLTWTTNDDFAAAQPLPNPAPGGFATFGVHNEGTGPQSGEPRHHGQVTTTSVWYSWTAPFTGIAEFETTQNNFDPVLAVYTGSRVDALTEVTSNDDLQPGVHRARVRFNAKAGTTYRIALAGLNGQSGFEVVRYTLTKPEIIAGTATTIEGATGASKIVNLPVSLTTASPSTVTVRFATADGTARAGTDYIATSGTLTFPA